jgi:LCP family protein required for cell wall assembly
MFSARGGTAITGKVGYTVSCILAALVLVVSGFAYYVKAKADSFGSSSVLSGGPSTGPMNILLMGLESRTYWDGKPLPRGLEDVMQIGHSGGNATNTLILIHIFAGGQKAVGFSIPRDNLVTMYGTDGYGGTKGKIDQAYGFAMANKMNHLAQQDPNMSSVQRNFLGNEAGRLAEVQTIEQLTGVHIDHFAELNLDGFYELANVFGGTEVCITPTTVNGVQNANLYDTNSGWNAVADGYNLKKGGTQYLHLAAGQALAFIRDRDSLPGTDLGRTKRQQAVIDYVIWKLRHQGVLSDISQLNSLLNVAKQYLITSSGWDMLQFAGEMKSLTGKNLSFQTLPVSGYQTEYLDGSYQAVNIVNPAGIKKIVHDTFYPSPASAGSAAHPARPAQQKRAAGLAPAATTMDVYNGGHANGLAAQLSQALTSAGYKAGKVGNITARSSTEVLYGTGAAASAAKIAGYFSGVTATASSSVAAGHVEVLLGADATSVPSGVRSSSASGSSPSSSGSPSSGSSSGSSSPSSSGTGASPATSSSNNGAAGGTISVRPNARYGIPCVY